MFLSVFGAELGCDHSHTHRQLGKDVVCVFNWNLFAMFNHRFDIDFHRLLYHLKRVLMRVAPRMAARQSGTVRGKGRRTVCELVIFDYYSECVSHLQLPEPTVGSPLRIVYTK